MSGIDDLKKFKELLESLPDEVKINIIGETRDSVYDEVNPTLLR